MRVRRHTGTIVVAVTVILLSGLIWANRERFTPLEVGSVAPDYDVVTLAGDTVALASFRGDVVLLNIWATWCLPCVQEMPALQRLHEELAPHGLRVVAVSVDAPPGILAPSGPFSGDIQAFVNNFNLTFTVLHDPSGRIQSRYQVNGLPTTFIIDRDGRIRRRVLGAAEWDAPRFADDVRRVLEG
jgi:cytochrome c biogenesis protein CcmG, thiol:disulfide interchange protein DsbE